jgi:hypothetical protein
MKSIPSKQRSEFDLSLKIHTVLFMHFTDLDFTTKTNTGTVRFFILCVAEIVFLCQNTNRPFPFFSKLINMGVE